MSAPRTTSLPCVIVVDDASLLDRFGLQDLVDRIALGGRRDGTHTHGPDAPRPHRAFLSELEAAARLDER
ncbi:hypothetical protein [Streptomyces megasporus]|uniref:hypothetical protein n=1 Tax=Streptomyces megasporus TaxID=44060 RepID=UPI0004E0D928|nr:hypothetical protein [Streptomyces megasporus]